MRRGPGGDGIEEGAIIRMSRRSARQATWAGGIGFELVGSMKLFQYQDTATCILVIIAMVMAADYMSTWLRARIQQGS